MSHLCFKIKKEKAFNWPFESFERSLHIVMMVMMVHNVPRTVCGLPGVQVLRILCCYIFVRRTTRAAQETGATENVHTSDQDWTFKEGQDQTPALSPPLQMKVINPGDMHQC